MNLTGKMLGHGAAYSATGKAEFYLLVEPAKGPDNLNIMGRECHRWKQIAERFRQMSYEHTVQPVVVKRAGFADEVMACAAEKMRLGESGILVAQAEDGRILGVMTFGYPSATEGAINLLAVDPENLTGSPGTEQLRGIGTALVACVSREFLAKKVNTIFIHPLDEAAALFWARRGFGVCGAGGLLCIRDKKKIEALINGCEVDPDYPDRDFVMCGRPQAVEMMRVPGR